MTKQEKIDFIQLKIDEMNAMISEKERQINDYINNINYFENSMTFSIQAKTNTESEIANITNNIIIANDIITDLQGE